MIGNCRKCELPEIVAEIGSLRTTSQIAQENLQESSSPTEADKWRATVQEHIANLSATEQKYADFVNSWRGTCPSCKHGA